jgi:hypothetical protein
MRIRPEAEQKLRAGFQRRAAEQSMRYAGQLAHAEELARRFGYGEVAGLFSARAGGGVRRRTYVVALAPLAAIPLLIAGAGPRFPALLPVIFAFPFAVGAWFGLCFWLGREPRRHVWLYAFTEGFWLRDDHLADAAPVRWSQVSQVHEVWTKVYHEDGVSQVLTAYRLLTADGRACEVPRTFRNVQDPYREVGQLLRGLAPGSIGKVMPRFPTIDEIIAAYARKPGP